MEYKDTISTETCFIRLHHLRRQMASDKLINAAEAARCILEPTIEDLEKSFRNLSEREARLIDLLFDMVPFLDSANLVASDREHALGICVRLREYLDI